MQELFIFNVCFNLNSSVDFTINFYKRFVFFLYFNLTKLRKTSKSKRLNIIAALYQSISTLDLYNKNKPRQ